MRVLSKMRLVAGCALLGASFFATAAEAKALSFAIVVGNNASPLEDAALLPLRFADDDAVRYHQLFSRLAADTRLLSVLDKDTQRRHPGLAAIARAPTLENLEQAFSELSKASQAARAAGHTTTLYFVFSGHGADDKSGEAYLALLGRGLTRRVLFDELLARFPADRVHLIIDACNAGALVSGRGHFDREIEAQSSTVSAAEIATVLGAGLQQLPPHIGAIVATSAGRESHEWSRIESGVFTHELLSGLLGPADVNGDLAIEYSEIEAFVASANSQVADPRSKPDIEAHPPALDQRTPLIALNQLQSGTFLRASRGGLGRFHIELENGQRYLDAHLAPEMPMVVSLPANVSAFVRTEDKEARIPGRASGVTAVEELRFAGRSLAHRGRLDDEYRRSLFAAPYDQKYYRGYVDSRALVPVSLEGQTQSAFLVEPDLETAQVMAIGLWGLAGASAIAAVVTGVMAANTRAEFEATTIQAEATRLSSRYDALLVATWVGAGTALISGGAGTFLWFTSGPETAEPSATESGIRAQIHARWAW